MTYGIMWCIGAGGFPALVALFAAVAWSISRMPIQRAAVVIAGVEAQAEAYREAA